MSSSSSSSSSFSPPSRASPPPPPAPPPAVYPPFLDPSLSVRRPSRVIMHVDMDCFYASVESQRFPHFLQQPLGVIQNGTLCVTTSYRCRVRGLPKMGAPADFASLCPSMRFAGSDMVRYRAASRQWHRIFASFTGVTVMKRSIDEAYLDLTAVVRQRIRQRRLMTPVPHSDPESLRLIAQRRHAAADCAWREEEAKLQQRFGSIAPHLLESSGTITAAVRASKSTDPISQLREQQRQAITGGGVEDYRKGKMRLDPALAGRTEEELTAIGNALHPVDFCRAQKAQTAAVELQPDSDDRRRQVRGLLGFKWAPWVGEVFLSGEEEEAKEDSAAAEEELQAKETVIDAAEAEAEDDADVDEDTQDISTLHAALSSSSLRPPPVDFSLEDPDSPSDDFLLCVGSQLCFEIRQRLFLQMGLTSSAGVAPNPMLAKLASSLHKPNQQSVVRRSIVQGFLAPLKLSKVSGFGPKASERVAAAGVCLVSDVQSRSYASLVSEFGSRFGSWLWSIGQGEDETPVEETGPPKSIGQSKRQRTATEDEKLNLLYWLASKLYERIDEDEREYARFPSSLALGWINVGTWDIVSRRLSIPYLREKTDPVQFLYEQSIALLKEHVPAAATLRCLSLTASNFIPLPSAKSISSYFKHAADGGGEEERKDSRADDGGSITTTVPLTANPYVGPSFTARYREAKQKVKKKTGKSAASSLLSRPGKERTIDTFATLMDRNADRQPEQQSELSIDAEDDIALLFGHAEDSSQSLQQQQPPASPPPPPLEHPTALPASPSQPAAAPQPAALLPPSAYQCAVCSQSVLETARAEHDDYHYALSLQSAVRAADRKQREEEEEKRRQDRRTKRTRPAAVRPSAATAQRVHSAGQEKKISAFFPIKNS